MNKLLQYRKYFLLTSQIIGMLLCIYLIYNVNSYEISWNLFNYWLPGIAQKINSFLHTVGTYVLVIPLTIIILSLVYPENYSLKFMSSFFGVASTILIIATGFWRNTIGEVYNMRIFLIQKKLTLDQKIEIFKTEYMQIITEKFNKSLDLYTHLNEHLTQNYIDIYKIKLETLYDSISVKLYANEVIQGLVNNFLDNKENHLKETALTYVTVLRYASYTAITIITLALGFTLLRMFLNSDQMIEGAKLAKGTAELAAKNNDNLISTQEVILGVIEKINEGTTAVTGAILTTVAEKIKEALQPTASAFARCESRLETLENTVSIQATAIDEIQNKLIANE